MQDFFSGNRAPVTNRNEEGISGRNFGLNFCMNGLTNDKHSGENDQQGQNADDPFYGNYSVLIDRY